jgi:hypothetical protein
MRAGDKPAFFVVRFGAAVRLYFVLFGSVRVGVFATAETGDTGAHRKPQGKPSGAAWIVKNRPLPYKAQKWR